LKQRGIQRPPLFSEIGGFTTTRSGFDIETRRTLLCLSACSSPSVYEGYSPFYLIRFLMDEEGTLVDEGV
jgi:hypothetical protein